MRKADRNHAIVPQPQTLSPPEKNLRTALFLFVIHTSISNFAIHYTIPVKGRANIS